MADFGDISLFEEFEKSGDGSSALMENSDRWNDQEKTGNSVDEDYYEPLHPFKVPRELSDEAPGLQLTFLNDPKWLPFRAEIEGFLGDLASRLEEEREDDIGVVPPPFDSAPYLGPEDSGNPSGWRAMGLVQFYPGFMVDAFGQPLFKSTHELTSGWDVPTFERLVDKCIPTEEIEEGTVPKGVRKNRCCFNCGEEDHAIADCPQPRNQKEIQRRKAEIRRQNNVPTLSGNKAKIDVSVDPRFKNFRPGVISEELQEALGCGSKKLPMYIYKMRCLGYPPGWLEDSKLTFSGLSMYAGDESSAQSNGVEGRQDRIDDGFDDDTQEFQLNKLIGYPGFNVPMPKGVPDEYGRYGSRPINTNQFLDRMRQDFSQRNEVFKRRHGVVGNDPEDEDVPSAKRSRTSMDNDMDLSEDDSSFRPPLPPGTPPPGTPPAPLPNTTPPLTPKTPAMSTVSSSEGRLHSEADDSDGIIVEDELEDGEMSPSPPPSIEIIDLGSPSSSEARDNDAPAFVVPALPANSTPKEKTVPPIPATTPSLSHSPSRSDASASNDLTTPATPDSSLHSISLTHSTPIPCRFDVSALLEDGEEDADQSVESTSDATRPRFIESDPSVNRVMPTPDQWAKNVSEHMDFVNLPNTEGAFSKIKKIVTKAKNLAKR